ncbi:hypothetical protein ACQP2Y_12600 [Actinoplanes sp. CA-051413]|uniref:hypothetical protein n=1 Tax=Actinoplanes sp. CA-051413 TaxID=3239899 RepID=UPI003D987A7F
MRLDNHLLPSGNQVIVRLHRGELGERFHKIPDPHGDIVAAAHDHGKTLIPQRTDLPPTVHAAQPRSATAGAPPVPLLA